MKSFVAIFVACLAVAGADFDFATPGQQLSGDAIWVEAPKDSSSFPTFGPNTHSSTNGMTLTEMCAYVLINNALPWAVPTNDQFNLQNFNLPEHRFPPLSVIQNFCQQLQQNNNLFVVPGPNAKY